MRRRLSAALVLVSLIFGGAACAMWVRSFYCFDMLHLGRVTLVSTPQQFWFAIWNKSSGAPKYERLPEPTWPASLKQLLPLAYRPPLRSVQIHVPYWMPLVLFATPPVLWWRRRRGAQTAAGFPVDVGNT